MNRFQERNDFYFILDVFDLATGCKTIEDRTQVSRFGLQRATYYTIVTQVPMAVHFCILEFQVLCDLRRCNLLTLEPITKVPLSFYFIDHLVLFGGPKSQ